MYRLLSVILLATLGSAQAQDSNPVQFPPRIATPADAELLAQPKNAVVKQELARIGLHQIIGRTCTTLVTADSIRPIETPIGIKGASATLPYASFLIWSADRPFGDALLYHLFGATDALYKQPQTIPLDASRRVAIILAPRQPYPTAAEVAGHRASFSTTSEIGPFTSADESSKLSVRPYVMPFEAIDPASVFPGKDERTMQITCLSDPNRTTNCLCAGTD